MAGQEAPTDVGIAREVAVQEQGTTSSTQGTSTAAERLEALTPVVPVADGAPRAQAEDAPPERQAVRVGPDRRALELSYQLDRASNTWVTRILDADSGEVVRQVPSTRVLHQLAELSQAPRVDRRA
jgi:hypothetical protein